jgi:hypothetical protein
MIWELANARRAISAAEESIDINAYIHYRSVSTNNRKKYFNETKML